MRIHSGVIVSLCLLSSNPVWGQDYSAADERLRQAKEALQRDKEYQHKAENRNTYYESDLTTINRDAQLQKRRSELGDAEKQINRYEKDLNAQKLRDFNSSSGHADPASAEADSKERKIRTEKWNRERASYLKAHENDCVLKPVMTNADLAKCR